MVVKLYADLLSQPARAIALFLKVNKIPHELKVVSIAKVQLINNPEADVQRYFLGMTETVDCLAPLNCTLQFLKLNLSNVLPRKSAQVLGGQLPIYGENRTPEYMEQIHRFGKVPAIDDDGVNLIESIAILRYLSRKYNVPDHWYPKDIQKQAKVDEFLEWHHIGQRLPLSMYFVTVFLKPRMTGEKPQEKHVQMWKGKMEEALDLVENVWLHNTSFLTGSEISIADLIGISEMEQPRMANYDVTIGRPKIAAWMKRVQDELQPHYDEVFKFLNKLAERNKAKL